MWTGVLPLYSLLSRALQNPSQVLSILLGIDASESPLYLEKKYKRQLMVCKAVLASVIVKVI